MTYEPVHQMVVGSKVAVTDLQPFAPVLTVCAHYGNAQFLWLVERPDLGDFGLKPL